MSLIQKLREKAAWIITGAIAFALLVFIVEEGLRNKSIFGGSQTTLGKVNGTKIDVTDFEKRFKQLEDRYTQYGYPLDDNTRMQQRASLWEQYVEDAVMESEYDALGLDVTDKELGDFLYGANPPQDFRQRFTDPKTGIYNAAEAYQAIQQLKKQKNSADYKSFFGDYVPALIKQRKREKFEALIANSVYIPKWMVEKMSAENSQIASISYVNVPYGTISDTSVKVTDEEIDAFVKKHPQAYKQEKAASIDYVSFDAAPSKLDTANTINQLENLRKEFDTLSDVSSFLSLNSESAFFDGFVLKSKMQVTLADSVQKLADGAVMGPYADGGSFTVARMISKRMVPDSVKCRHILIKIADQQTGQIRTDEQAKKIMDSVETALKGGASFDAMVAIYNEDEGSKATKGEYTFGSIQLGTISKEFGEVIFYGKTGDKKVVRVENPQYSGYHYIEVLSQKNFEEAYKVGYLSKRVVSSDETINAAMGLASQFAAENRNKKSFDADAKKKGLNVFSAPDVKPLDANIQGVMGNARELVRWIYNDAKIDQVTERPFSVGEKFLVPVVTQKFEEGTMVASKARPLCEFLIKKEKKAAQISAKIGNGASLEDVAKNTGQQLLHADSLSFGVAQIANVGFEPKVVGAAFNKDNAAKISSPIPGELGVFVIKTNKVAAVPNPAFDVKTQQANFRQQQMMYSQRSIVENMKKSANIKDNRYKFF